MLERGDRPVLGQQATREMLERELPAFFPDIHIKVDDDIDV